MTFFFVCVVVVVHGTREDGDEGCESETQTMTLLYVYREIKWCDRDSCARRGGRVEDDVRVWITEADQVLSVNK